MKLLTKNTDYAVRALLHCALDSTGRYVPSSEMAQAQGIPLRFLRSLLQKLIKGGFLEAREGKSGGVRLAKPPESITVLDLMRLLQGELHVSECLFRRRLCPARTGCVLRRRLLSIENGLSREFAAITIGGLARDLFGGKKPGKRND